MKAGKYLVTPSKLDLATRVTIGSSLLIVAMVLADSFGAQEPTTGAARERNPDFLHAAAGIEGRLQTLRHMEKQMLAEANPERAALYRQKREQARRRIDELMLTARATARSGEERERLEQLAAQAQ